MDSRITECHSELKRLRDLQFESDFNDNSREAEFYRQKAEHIQSLMKQGVEYLPNF